MTPIEKIRADIQKKRLEREEAVKRILADIQKKRKTIEEYRKESKGLIKK